MKKISKSEYDESKQASNSDEVQYKLDSKRITIYWFNGDTISIDSDSTNLQVLSNSIDNIYYRSISGSISGDRWR